MRDIDFFKLHDEVRMLKDVVLKLAHRIGELGAAVSRVPPLAERVESLEDKHVYVLEELRLHVKALDRLQELAEKQSDEDKP